MFVGAVESEGCVEEDFVDEPLGGGTVMDDFDYDSDDIFEGLGAVIGGVSGHDF